MHKSEPHLAYVSCASIPREALHTLAEVRDRSEVRIALCGGRAWVRWEAHEEQVLRALLPVAGVDLYVQREGQWYRHGHHLPAFDFPQQADYQPLHQVLTPIFHSPPLRARVGVGGGARQDPQSQPVTLQLVADSLPHAATALRVRASELARWADSATTACIESLHAAYCQGRVLLRGLRLPPLPVGERFWGDAVWVPLGYRPKPDLPATAIRQALGIAEDELLLLTKTGAEVLPTTAFRPLTRAQLRLALQETAP